MIERILSSKRYTAVGFLAAAITASGPLWASTALGSIVGIPLSVGVLVGGALFGGLHNAPPVVPVFAIATLINGFLWSGIARLTRWGRRSIQHR